MKLRLFTAAAVAAMVTAAAITAQQSEPAEAVFQQLLAAAQENDRERAMGLIERLRATDGAIGFLQGRLEKGDEAEIALALMTLEGMKDKAEQVTPILLALTSHSDARIRGAATMSIINVDRSEQTIDRLIELLQDDSPVVRWKAGYCFKEIGPDASKAVPALIKAIDDPDRDVRGYAVTALGAIHSQPDISVPALIHALDVSAMDAAIALRAFGTEAAPAAPALVSKLEESVTTGNSLAAREIVNALAVTSSPQARQALPVIRRLLAKETADNVKADLANAIATIEQF